MDPLSVIASIFAIVGAGGQVAKQVKKILALRIAPDNLLALNNEISEVHCTVQDINNVLQQYSRTNNVPPASLIRALENTRATVLEVESVIAYDLTIIASDDGTVKIDKSRWLRAGPRVQALKERMRSDRNNLSLGLSVLASYGQHSSLSVKFIFKDNGFADKRRLSGIEASSQARQIIVSVEAFHRQIRETGLSLAQQSNRTNDDHTGTRRITDSIHGVSADPFDNDTRPSTNTALNTASASVPYPKSSHEGPPIKLTLASTENCTLDCHCTCHINSFTRSPQFLTRVLGSLFLGYRAAPRFAPPCNDPLCRAGAVRVLYVYAFPRWLISRALQASVSFNYASGPEFILRVMRIRDFNTGPFQFTALSKKYSKNSLFLDIKASIDHAESSVLDMTPNGWTLLHYALSYMNYDLIEFLIKAGADVLYQNEAGRSPYVLAWTDVLVEPDREPAQRLLTLFDRSYLYQFGFSELHKAYLGLSGTTFLTILGSIDKTMVDSEDASFRTVLSWAAQRGDENAISRLLTAGANPNKPDKLGKTPLHWTASTADSEGCIAQLLAAKAHVGITDYNGLTSLHYAAYHNHAKNFQFLLKSGADSNALDEGGRSALHFTILNSSHSVLPIILDWGGEDVFPDRKGNHFLIFLARYADETSLQIVNSFVENLAIDPDRKEAIVCEALEVAKWRKEMNEDTERRGRIYDLCVLNDDPKNWFNSFEELANNISNLPSYENDDWEATSKECMDDSEREDHGNDSSEDDEAWEDAQE